MISYHLLLLFAYATAPQNLSGFTIGKLQNTAIWLDRRNVRSYFGSSWKMYLVFRYGCFQYLKSSTRFPRSSTIISRKDRWKLRPVQTMGRKCRSGTLWWMWSEFSQLSCWENVFQRSSCMPVTAEFQFWILPHRSRITGSFPQISIYSFNYQPFSHRQRIH